MASQGGKLEEGETRLTLLEDGDEELNNGEKPEVLPESQALTPPSTPWEATRRGSKGEKTKQKKLFSQHMGLILPIRPLCSWYLT